MLPHPTLLIPLQNRLMHLSEDSQFPPSYSGASSLSLVGGSTCEQDGPHPPKVDIPLRFYIWTCFPFRGRGARAVGVLKLVAARDMPRISSWSNKIKQIFQDGSKDGLRNKERCVKMKKMLNLNLGPWDRVLGQRGYFRMVQRMG